MVTQNQLEITLEKLVAIPSVSSNAEACHLIIDLVREQLEPHGFFITTETNTPNPWLIATTKETKEPDILLAAHLDVVPGDAEQFTMKKEDGKLKGRGIYDMKLAAACYLELVKAHSDKLHELNIGFMFTTDEEIGSPNMPTIMESGWRPKVAFIPDGGDNWFIEERAKGFYAIELTATGKTAHGSRPWEGENALHTLLDALSLLREAYPPSEHPGDPTLAINELHAGTTINQIADYASAKIDFRSFENKDIEDYKTLIDTVSATYSLSHQVSQSGESVAFNKKSPYVQHFLEVLRTETGKDITYCESYGGSDARFFAQYGIPTIIVEPHGGSRHAPDEWILAEDLVKYYRLIERWILG